ncbi:MAG: hypothetical protein ACO1PM_08180 [Acidovorax sp.]
MRQALYGACKKHATKEQGTTLRELAALAGVGLDAAGQTLENMVRAGQLGKLKSRRVDYCSKPVAEYVPADLMPHAITAAPEPSGGMVLVTALQAWAA